MAISKIVIRVYGIWIDEKDQVLLSDEIYDGTAMTKFPGGGIEFGEGPIDCLKREWKEEVGVDIHIIDHLYTTDFFQKSAFHEDAQILSIYYRVEPREEVHVELNGKPGEGIEAFRKVSIAELNLNDVTFPIDKKVIELIKTN